MNPGDPIRRDIEGVREEHRVDTEATNRRMDDSDILAKEQRSEADVSSRRITDVEGVLQEVHNSRISARIAYLIAGVAMFAALSLLWAGLNEVESQQKEIEQLTKSNRALILRVESEGKSRRHQICLGDEREHRAAVRDLRLTYRYIAGLPEDDRQTPINRLIISELPSAERDARNDTAPPFCDKPGAVAEALFRRTDGAKGMPPVGLPEPDPVVPERPPEVDRIFREVAAEAKAR